MSPRRVGRPIVLRFLQSRGDLMTGIDSIIEGNGSKNIAIYGLGTETERFLSGHGDISVAGLLDGFRTDGEIYGYPIIPIEETIEKGVRLIIVVARPGSCKAITKRIGRFCRDNCIALFDVRGKDLLAANEVTYDFCGISVESKQVLLEKINEADVVSFDLLDTLLMRKVMYYTDVFGLLEIRLQDMGIIIPGLSDLRLRAEKECSKTGAPTLEEIYEKVLENAGCSTVSARELAAAEWELDRSIIVSRRAVCDLYKDTLRKGKRVVITTDNYYTKDRIKTLLEENGMDGYDDLIVSCDRGTLKTQNLFEELVRSTGAKPDRILHIGDDETADIECAQRYGIRTFRLYSAADLFDALGELGTEEVIDSVSDRVKIGLVLSRLFNNPFRFEDEERRLFVKDVSDIGYLFCAPMITDFTLWMKDCAGKQGYDQILLGARDGYLLHKLFEKSDDDVKAFYFYTSRTAAIRAGMELKADIDYVDSMKFSGTVGDEMRVRFGLETGDSEDIDRNGIILAKAKRQRENYHKYIRKLGIGDGKLAFFDFVAKGTTQMYLQKLFRQHIKGFYFLQLEPEFMEDKGLDIEPFYSDEEKDSSEIFDNYYILETMLTAPHPQVVEMDETGDPVFTMETRSERDLKCFERAQKGIEEFFEEYLDIVPESARRGNKKLDEVLLALINKVKILDEDFLSLTVEDPFFGRMTDIKDVIG